MQDMRHGASPWRDVVPSLANQLSRCWIVEGTAERATIWGYAFVTNAGSEGYARFSIARDQTQPGGFRQKSPGCIHHNISSRSTNIG